MERKRRTSITRNIWLLQNATPHNWHNTCRTAEIDADSQSLSSLLNKIYNAVLGLLHTESVNALSLIQTDTQQASSSSQSTLPCCSKNSTVLDFLDFRIFRYPTMIGRIDVDRRKSFYLCFYVMNDKCKSRKMQLVNFLFALSHHQINVDSIFGHNSSE